MYGDCLSNLSSDYGLYISLLIGGFVGSLAHCSMMCGPLVLVQIGALPDNVRPRARLLLPYHLGRITTYMFLAVLFGFLTGLSSLFGFPKAVLTAFLLSMAALMFFVTAIPQLSTAFPWASRIGLPIPNRWISALSRPLMVRPQGWRGYVLGIILGFMPCGLVIAALMAAATAANPVAAALAMAAFGLGTLPVLMTIGLGGTWIKRRFPLQIKWVSGIILAVNGFWLIWLATQQVI